MLKAAPSEDWRGAILCGYTTGLRLKDVTDLTWSSVDLVEQTITIRLARRARNVTLPIHPDFAAWLKRQTRGIGRAPVFPSLVRQKRGGKGGSVNGVQGHHEGAGIAGRPLREAPGPDAARAFVSFTATQLQFCFASCRRRRGDAAAANRAFASLAMNTAYTHRDLEVKRAAIALLPGDPEPRQGGDNGAAP